MFTIEINLSELENFERVLTELPEKVDAAMVEAMKEAEVLGHSALNEHPEPIPYGHPRSEEPKYDNTNVKWDTLRQRAWYNHNKDMPYQRAGALYNALEESEPNVQLGLITAKVYSIEDWVKYVIGSKDQSDIHKLRDDPWQTDVQTAQRIKPQVREFFVEAVRRVIAESLRD